MDTLNKIVQLLDVKGCTQKALTDYLGLDKTTFSAWKSGKSKSFIKLIPQIAEFFDVPVGYFCDNDNNSSCILSSDELDFITKYRHLSKKSKAEILNSLNYLYEMEASKELSTAVVDIKHSIFKVSAGVGEWLPDPEAWDTMMVIDTPQVRKADFSLTIQGDSMLPDYKDGDIILVRSQPSVNLNDICVYYVNGKGYIKKFGGDRLISLNSKYPDIILSEYDPDEIRCWGLVVGVV